MNAKVVVLPYLQKWNGNSLDLSLLLIPRGDPRDLLGSSNHNFATIDFVFDIHILPGLGVLPTVGSGSVLTTKTLSAVPTALPIFDGVLLDLAAKSLTIDPSPPGSGRSLTPGQASVQVRKYLPISYQRASGYTPSPDSSLFVTDHTYFCTLKMRPNPPLPYAALPKQTQTSWGRVVTALLRFPKLAAAAGLVRSVNGISVDPVLVKNGGYLFLALSAATVAAGISSDIVTFYAVRFPALDTSRDLFSPVFFPVTDPLVTDPSNLPTDVDYDEIFPDAEDYDDGWAKVVHCTQAHRLDPMNDDEDDGTRPAKEMGVRIGWDDERVTNWMNRQLSTDTSVVRLDSPLGIQGYRIDVQDAKTIGPWTSLTVAKGQAIINGVTYATYNGTSDELALEVHPARDLTDPNSEFWVPVYFSNWTGPSLVTMDEERMKFAGGKPDATSPKVRGLVPPGLLVYGNNYNFRVRLMDHTGGGPLITSSPANPGANPVAFHPFRRWIRPLAPTIVTAIPGVPDPKNPPTSIEIACPLILYPAVLCTGKYTSADLTVPGPNDPEPGLPDPDVVGVEIKVLVGTLHQDPLAVDGTYKALYTTTRFFTSNRVTVDINWNDYNDITNATDFDIPKYQAATTGPLSLPSARDIRLRIRALCKTDQFFDYFGADDVRQGPTAILSLRKTSSTEINFFTVPSENPSGQLNAYVLQPDVPVLANAQQLSGKAGIVSPDVPSRLASALDLRNTDLAFRPPPGSRFLFGCSSTLRHTLGPDLASITFSSKADISLIWVVVLRVRINRDWTWDGLDRNGLIITRDGAEIGRMSSNYSVSHDAVSSSEPHSGWTDLIIFDAIDPKPVGNNFPQIIKPSYQVSATCNGSTITSPTFTITLPIATAPLQVPKIVSAGIAMSQYTHPPDYSSTASRDKRLWIEFNKPIQDPNDQYFARVLGNGPDPQLYPFSLALSVAAEPELAIDPEPTRRIIPGQADDQAGLNAMQPLTKSTDSDVHYYLPLPPGLTSTSPELFGFFTYELRVGHAVQWSTAQARFSGPFRVAGVQHPPPQLICTAVRTGSSNSDITVSAPFAKPVVDGVDLSRRDFTPNAMWALLYAQACQLDDSSTCRNVLLLPPRQMMPPEKNEYDFWAGYGRATFPWADVVSNLTALGFDSTAPLSVLAVEMLPQGVLRRPVETRGLVVGAHRGQEIKQEDDNDVDADSPRDPLGLGLGSQRILRTSLLTPVPTSC